MDVLTNGLSSNVCDETLNKNDFLEITSNWQINNGKRFCDAVTTGLTSESSERINFEEIVSFNTCIALESERVQILPKLEPCMIDIKLKNHQKITRIAVVSEARILEFFKQYGEYATTVFSDFVDEFESTSVYIAEANIEPPATEASIKFTKVKSPGSAMWIYGIRLILTNPVEEIKTNMFNHDVIKSFLPNSDSPLYKQFGMAKKVLEMFSNDKDNAMYKEDLFYKDFVEMSLRTCADTQSNENIKANGNEEDIKYMNDNVNPNGFDVKAYIDNKFHDMESKLIQKMNEIESNTNRKLDAILERLEMTLH